MTDRSFDQLLDAWMDLGPNAAPARVVEAVRLEAHSTRQTAGLRGWPPRRFPEMNKALVYGVAAAAVVIVAILGVSLLAPAGLSVGRPAETPTPTPAPSPMALPAPRTALEAGTYAIDEVFPFRVTFEVPDGWSSCRPGDDEFGACAFASDPDATMAIAFMTVDNVVADPCDRQDAQLDPPVGPSVDDLVTAISNLQGFDATDATDVTVDGFSGKQFELTAPDGNGGCAAVGDDGFGTWTTPSRTNGVGPGEVNLLRVLDVDGVRLVVTAGYHPATVSADEVAEIRRVFESVHIAS